MKKTTDYKRNTLTVLIITVIAFVIFVAANTMKASVKAATIQEHIPQNYTNNYIADSALSQESEDIIVNEDKERYLITVHNGYIAVFKNDEKEPVLLADIEVYLLPEDDIKILREGIYVSDIIEAKQVLEDYE